MIVRNLNPTSSSEPFINLGSKAVPLPNEMFIEVGKYWENLPNNYPHTPIFIPFQPLGFLMVPDKPDNLFDDRVHIMWWLAWLYSPEPRVVTYGLLCAHINFPSMPLCLGRSQKCHSISLDSETEDRRFPLNLFHLTIPQLISFHILLVAALKIIPARRKKPFQMGRSGNWSGRE
jgi:hypothetical protein